MLVSARFLAIAVAAGLAGATTGCVEMVDDPLDDGGGTGGKDDRGGSGGFVEVDPTHSSATFRTYVERAINRLAADDSDVARLTAASIRAGRVRIDELVDMTCWDFERARQEVPELGLTSADWPRLRQPNSSVARALTAALDGYMWSDRIYISRGQATGQLAATLAHEVNHVINRSEVGYWDDFPTSAFVHEYRAFHVESVFDPDAYQGVELADYVIELYEFDRDAIDPDVLAAPLTPRLVPDADAWADRRVGDDPVDVDADCPGWP